jgi:hypothetical protein
MQLNMGEKFISGYYRTPTTHIFKLDLFEDEVRPVLDYVIKSDDVDTTGFSRLQIFKLAVDVAKKRQVYKPKKKKAPVRATTSRVSQLKSNARAIYQALVAGVNAEKAQKEIVSPAVASASKAAASKSVTAAFANASVAAAVQSAAGAKGDTDTADSDDLFGDSDEEATLEKYNKKCQERRAEAKVELAKKKSVQAKLAKEKAEKKAKLAKEKAEQKAKLAKEKAEKKAKLAKEKAEKKSKLTKKKKAELAKKKKAEQEAKSTHDAYVKGTAKNAVATSKARSLHLRNKKDCLFKVGMRVNAFWPDDHGDGGQWYDGTIITIDYFGRTISVEYDDGDVDDAVPWHKSRILGDPKAG